MYKAILFSTYIGGRIKSPILIEEPMTKSDN